MFTVLRLRPIKPNKKLIFGSIVLVLILAGLTGYLWAVKTVTIIDADSQVELRTRASTVEELLQKQGIKYEAEDIIRPTLSTPLAENMTITIARAVDVRVEVDGRSLTVSLAEPTVAKVLALANIALTPLDQVKHNLDITAAKGKILQISRIEEKKIEQTASLEIPIKREPDQSLARGQTKVVQPGAKGLVKEIILVTYTDGKETKREVVAREVLKEPKPKIISYGTKEAKVVQASRELSSRKALAMEATAYTHTGNKTATGINPHVGVIAVDPKLIPLGTELYVEGYGYGEALDTGGSIKGNRIDLFFETRSESIKWGRRNVKVYILD